MVPSKILKGNWIVVKYVIETGVKFEVIMQEELPGTECNFMGEIEQILY
jgi:hypothetical protein